MLRKIEQVDLATGEIMQGCMVWVPQRPKVQEDFFMIFQNALIDLAKDRELTLEPKNVLLFLLGKLDFENFIHVSQQAIAGELGMNSSHVSRAMKILTDKQIVLTGPKHGRLKCYRLNPNYGWKGKVKNLRNHQEELREQRRAQLTVVEGGKHDGQ